MAELPNLPRPILRLHSLRWAVLIEKHGFTGAHLKWHESQDMRRQAARPRHSLAPPPATRLDDNTPPRIFYGTDGQPILHEEFLEQAMAAWVVRESDPDTIDSIGVAATITLAEARFSDITLDYLKLWVASTSSNSEEFRHWSIGIAQSVAREVGDLWRKDQWHTAWFERACHKKVDEALVQLSKKWSDRATKLEIQSLENPHLSLESLLIANGNLSVASTLEEGKRKIETSDASLSEVTGGTLSKAENMTIAPQGLAEATDPGLDRTKMVDDFLLRCNRQAAAGCKVLRKHIWLAVGHAQARQLQYWQVMSGKATEENDRSFRRILAMPPAEFIELLKKKSILP